MVCSTSDGILGLSFGFCIRAGFLLVASAEPIVSGLEAAVAPVRVPLSTLGLRWDGSIRSFRLSRNFGIFSVLFCCLFAAWEAKRPPIQLSRLPEP
jgi:hypothetical protein